jgi:hypothetical protein
MNGESAQFVILGPSHVILSAAKNPDYILLRINSAKKLAFFRPLPDPSLRSG